MSLGRIDSWLPSDLELWHIQKKKTKEINKTRFQSVEKLGKALREEQRHRNHVSLLGNPDRERRELQKDTLAKQQEFAHRHIRQAEEDKE